MKKSKGKRFLRLVAMLCVMTMVLSSVTVTAHAGWGDAVLGIVSDVQKVISTGKSYVDKGKAYYDQAMKYYKDGKSIYNEISKFAADPMSYIMSYILGPSDDRAKNASDKNRTNSKYYSLVVNGSMRLGYEGRMTTATDTNKQKTEYWKLVEPEPNYYLVNGQPKTSGTLGKGGCTVWFDAKMNRLYLQDYKGGPIGLMCYTEIVDYANDKSKDTHLKKPIAPPIVDKPYDNSLVIILSGNNVITDNVTSSHKDAMGICHVGRLDIRSDNGGTLTINSSVSRGQEREAYGIVAPFCSIYESAEVTINVTGPGVATGIRAFKGGQNVPMINVLHRAILKITAKSYGTYDEASANGIQIDGGSFEVATFKDTTHNHEPGNVEITCTAEGNAKTYPINNAMHSSVLFRQSGLVTLRWEKDKGAMRAYDAKPVVISEPIEDVYDHSDEDKPYIIYRGSRVAKIEEPAATEDPLKEEPVETAPPVSADPLKFTKQTAFDIPAGNTYTAISTVNVADGVTGGTASFSFSKVSGPEWLKVSKKGVLSGSRQGAADATTAVIEVEDAAGLTARITIKVGQVGAGLGSSTTSETVTATPKPTRAPRPTRTPKPTTVVEADPNEDLDSISKPQTTKVPKPTRTPTPTTTTDTTETETPASTGPLKFTKQDSFNIPAGGTYVGITTIKVSSGVSGGTAPYKFTKVSGPDWLKVSTSGNLTGSRQSAAAETTAMIQVEDAAGVTRRITITVGQVGSSSGTSTTTTSGTSGTTTGTATKGSDATETSASSGPLKFTKQSSFDIPSGGTYTGISTINVSGGVSGGSTPYKFTKVSGPDWLRVSTAGALTGSRQSSAAATTAVIQVEDAAGVTRRITINIGQVGSSSSSGGGTTSGGGATTGTSETPPVTSSSPLSFTNRGFDIPSGNTYTGISTVNVTSGVSGGTPPYTFSKVNGPSWLNVGSTGNISGSRQGSASETTATIQVSDATGASRTITINVGQVGSSSSSGSSGLTTPVDTTPPTSGSSSSSGSLSFSNMGFDIPSGNMYTGISTVNVTGGVSGGSAPYTFSKVSGPSWLNVGSSGNISGSRQSRSPAESAVIRVTDSSGQSATITIEVGEVR